jgi:hypothetical protein
MSDNNPFQGLPPNLIPNPPGEIPGPSEAGDAVAGLTAFAEPQDVDAIIANLTLDRPLKLFIPDMHKYPGVEFHIINNIPHEIAAARRKGWREPSAELAKLFIDLVAGTDKDGKAYRPMLVVRDKRIGDHERKLKRQMLQSLYAGMNPANKDLSGKYTDNVDAKSGTKGIFTGDGWRIKI